MNRMTKQEAIIRIKNHMDVHRMYEPKGTKISEAFEMAIKSLEQQASDEIYSMMKDYYFKHRNDHDDSWQCGFAKCMNLIPNMYERREDG